MALKSLTRAEVTEPQGRSPQVRDHKHFTLTESTLKTHAVINQFECMYLVKAVKFTNRLQHCHVYSHRTSD